MTFRKRGLMFLVLLVAFSFADCRKIKTKVGIGELVEYPEEGTPEKVIQEVLKSALMAEEEGWQRFSTLLHSEEKTPSQLNNWRQFSYRELRKKADYFIKDKSLISFKIMREKDVGDSLKLFIENSMSDQPTPCTLKKDAAQNNAWKVFGSCL